MNEIHSLLKEQLEQYLGKDFSLPEELTGFIEAVDNTYAQFEQTETDLKLREQAIAASNNGIVIVDTNLPDAPMIYVNPAFERMTGYTQAESVGRNCRFLQGAKTDRKELNRLRDAIRSGENCTVVLRNYRKDGSTFWNQLNISPICDRSGKLTHFVGIQTDITARIRSEKQLQEKIQREQLFNRLTNQIRTTLDLDQILDTAVTEIRHLLNVERCLFAWCIDDIERPFWEVVKEAKEPDLDSAIGHYSGAEFGSLTTRMIVLTAHWIDDVNSTDDIVLQTQLVKFQSRSMLAVPIKASLGDIGVIWCHRSQPSPWTEIEIELLQSVAAQLAIAIDQAELYEQSRTTATAAQAQTQKLEQTLRKLQRAQTKLIQTEKMSGLGQLVAGVAHEINNPVNFIYGNINHTTNYAQDLLDLLDLYQQHYPQPVVEILEKMSEIDVDFLKEDLPKTLSSMKIGAERIRQIVLSLRNFSRLDEAEMKPVDIHEGIDSTLMILQHRLKSTDNFPAIALEKYYGDLPLIPCYAGQLNQVFMNILSNAIDALHEHFVSTSYSPTIVIYTEMREQETNIDIRNLNSAPQQISYAAIHIRDNGIGMTEAIKEQLFNPFFTTKPIGQGTGLGLAISHQIVVDRHGGQLQCVSEPGKGTEFIIEIPIKDSF